MARIEAVFGVKGQKEMSSAFGDIGLKLISVNQGIELVQKAFRALSAPFASVIKEGREFTAQMSAVQAVSSATKDEMARLTAEAKRLGATTAFTGTEAGQAMEELGRAGQDVATIFKTTNAALDLANANNANLANSAKLIAVQMNVFKDSMLTARNAADLINKTVSSAPLNFESLGFALTFVSGTAAAAGWNFKQLTQVIGAMAEAGIEGSKAGRALNTAIARLLKPTAEAQKALDRYGISIDDINPTMHNFAEIIDVLHQKNVELKDLFGILGIEAAPKFLKIIQGGGDTIRNFAEKQEQANTALEAAQIRLNNLDGDITIFNSALSGLKLSIFDALDTALRGIVQSGTKMLNVMNEFVNRHSGAITSAFDTIRESVAYFLIGLGELLILFGRLLRSGPVVDIFNTLKKTFIEVQKNAIAPLVIKIKEFINEFIRIITENEKVKKTIDILVSVLKGAIIIFGKIFQIIYKIVGIIIDLAKLALEPLLNSLSPVVDTFLELFRTIQNYVIVALDKLNNVLDDFSIDGVNKSFEFLKKALDETLKPFKLVRDGFEWITEKAKDLEEQLWGHSTVPAIEELGKASIEAGKQSKALGQELLRVKKSAEETETAIKKVSGANVNLNVKSQTSIIDDIKSVFSDLTTDIGGYFEKFSFSELGKSLGEGFLNTTSNLFRGLVNNIIGLFTSNEKFSAGLEKISATIAEVVAPLIEAFVPVLDALNESIKDLAPLFKNIVKDLGPLIKTLIDFLTQLTKATGPLIQGVLKRIIPFFQRVIAKIGPSLIKLTESVGPVLNAILDILIPIIDELLPIIKDIIDLIAELNPLIVAVLKLIKVFLPIIRAIIKIVSAVVHVIVNILKPIIQVLINIVKTITAVIEGVFKLLESIFRPIFDALLAILSTLIDTIKNLISSPFGSIGGGGGSSGGGLFGGLPGLGGGGGLFGFASGTGALSRDQLLRLPGMESNSGLIKAHVGEEIGKGNKQPIQFTFNINASDPKATVNELRRLIEELRIQGKL